MGNTYYKVSCYNDQFGPGDYFECQGIKKTWYKSKSGRLLHGVLATEQATGSGRLDLCKNCALKYKKLRIDKGRRPPAFKHWKDGVEYCHQFLGPC